MNKVIRIKVKHLLRGIGICLLLLMVSYIFLPSLMLSIGERYSRSGNSMAAKAYYDRLDKYFPYRSETATALEKAASITSNGNLLMVSSVGVGGATYANGIFSKEAQAYYEKLAERFPNLWQGINAKAQLSMQAVRRLLDLNQIDEAFDFMKSHYEEVNSNTKTILHDSSVALTAASVLKHKGLYKDGLKFVEYFINIHDSYYFDQPAYEFAAELHRLSGNFSEAERYYKLMLAFYEKESENGELEHTKYFKEKAREIIDKIAFLEIQPYTEGKVTGSITLRGTPLSSVQIFLQPQNDPEGGLIFGSTREDSLWTESDENGKFLFEHVLSGRYSLGFILNLDEVGDVVLKGGFFPQSAILVKENEVSNWDFQLVDTFNVISPIDNYEVTGDNLVFRWEDFEEAAYYTLELGFYSPDGKGSYSTVYSEKKFFTNEAVLSLPELTYSSTGLTFDDNGPTPYSLLGFAYPGGKYFWGVRAHDKEGNILSVSRGYLKSQNTDFRIGDRSLREADKLLLEGKFQEAITTYEDYLSKDPTDAHALAILAKLYGVSHGSYSFTDVQKSSEYYKRLYEILY